MSDLVTMFRNAAAKDPDHVAVRLDDAEVSYGQLADAANRVVRILTAAGVGPGDRVGVMLPNVPYFPMVYYGVLSAGGVVVPMNPLLKGREVAFYLTDSGAKHLFAWHDFAAPAAEGADAAGAEFHQVKPGEFEDRLAEAEPVTAAVRRDDEDLAIILYTSGTTGQPKGAELTHRNLGLNARYTAEHLIRTTSQDVVMGCLPFFHAFGQTCALNAGLSSGSTITLIARFDGSTALDVIARDKVTVFEGVPTMYSAMLAARDAGNDADTTSLRTCVSGGAALPVEVLRSFEETFGTIILEGYGLSETSPVASFNLPDKERRAGSIGTPIDGVEFRLIDDDGNDVPPGSGEAGDGRGEIAIRGHNVMKGYWNKPEATEAAFVDGWFRTGDVARSDEDGFYYIVDRKKDLIIRGGYNVYPRELEEVLYEHPAVMEAAVIGMPHASLGEEVGAAVALKAGAEASPEEIQSFCKERVAAYKYPRRIWIVDSLPKGPTGKVLRRSVRAPEEEG